MSKTFDLLGGRLMLHEEHAEFVARRSALRGIGASDAAKAAGVSPYGGPLRLWLEKMGRTTPEPMTAAQEWGLRLEPAIDQAYRERTGFAVMRPPEKTYVHPEESWVYAHPDRFVALPDGSNRFAELKTADSEWAEVDGVRQKVWGEEGTDQIPCHYFVQAQWQMFAAVRLRIEAVDVPVLFGGRDFRVYSVARNEEIQFLLYGACRELWRRVEAADPPPPDWTDPRTPELVQLLHRPAAGKVVRLDDPAAALLADQYQDLGAEAGRAEKARERTKALLVEMMRDAAEAELPDGRRIKRSLVPAQAPKMTEGRREYHTFRISQPKESAA